MYEPCKCIDTFYVAGFQRYDGMMVVHDIAAGDFLNMVPEPDNPYDPDAIKLEFNGTKIGYVPKEKNGLAALFAFYGHEDVFECRVTQVDPQAEPWKQVRVSLFITDKRPVNQKC